MEKAGFKPKISDFGIRYITQITPNTSPIKLEPLSYSVAYFDSSLYLIVANPDRSASCLMLSVMRRQSFSDHWSAIASQNIDLANDLSFRPDWLKVPSPDHDVSEQNISVPLSLQLVAQDQERLYLSISICDRTYLFLSNNGETFHRVVLPAAIQRSPLLSERVGCVCLTEQYLFILGSRQREGGCETVVWARSLQTFADQAIDQQTRTADLADLYDADLYDAIAFPVDEASLGEFEISSIQSFNDSVYIALSHHRLGFQLWRLYHDEQGMWRWQIVLEKGAHHYSLNGKVYALQPFQSELYILSGTAKRDTYGTKPWYTQQFEILKVYSDNDWDLMVGTPRFTPTGLKVPLSGSGANFETLENTNFQALIAYKHQLYVVVSSEEGLKFWVSNNGEVWRLIPDLSIQDYYCVDVYKSCSTPLGIVLLAKATDFDQNHHVQTWLVH